MEKSNFILLCAFVCLAVFLNFIPHLGYSYPLHIDEWVHMQYANNISSGSPLYFGQAYGDNLESGFHYLLAILNLIGVPYLFMFNFFPAIITFLMCISVFILTRRIWNEIAGVYSVLFIVLLQSSVSILGPVFLVPMALGLFLLLIGLYLVEIKSSLWFLILAFLLVMHPPTALAFFVLINIKFILIRKNYLINILLQGLAGLIALPLYFQLFLERGIETIDSLSFTPIVSALFIPRFLGLFIVAIVLAGIYISLTKRRYDLGLYSIALLVFILVAYQLKIEFFIPYPRALMYLFMIFAVVFGIGCEGIISFFKKWKILVAVILIVLVLMVALSAKIESNNYIYHISTEQDAVAFNWVKLNTPINSIAVLDPWKANAFTPLAERQVYSRIVQGPNKLSEIKNNEAYQFFRDSCTNTTFLDQNNISIIYGNCSGSNLKEAYPNVYLR